MVKDDIIVSINCTTYNHEDYIADAIESFLMQKTNFKYEILIHDDASTDRTAEIIKEYEKKYPDVIRPIYQIENQYSKGIKKISYKFNSTRAKGKYIALCEGDDFWTDPYKLQKQVDYMDRNPDCSMCVHAAYKVTPEKRKMKLHIRPNIGNKIFSVEEVIEGGGGLFATNSIMYSREKGIERPPFYENAPVGDYPLAIYLALQGTVYYIDEFMSAYRVGVQGSWTSFTFSDHRKTITHFQKSIDMLDEINNYTDFLYDKAIERRKRDIEFKYLLAQGRYSEIKIGKYSEIYDKLGVLQKIKLFLKQYCPNIIRIWKAIKGKCKVWALK
jgi:glycosyltransferase involved in cell wall biosynthesis